MARTVRTTALVSTSALALGFSLLATATAAAAPAAGAPTPHLDSVEQTLRQVSPGLQGSIWERTSGNRLGSSTPEGADWLLQTPGCWGDAACSDRPGSRRLLEKMRQDIADARQTVDISTLAPFPNGGYQEAIVAGLRESIRKGNRLKVRIMVGAAPVYHSTV
ncbi:phospholipase, partial [Streptomyces sp. NPDC059656]